MRDRIPLLAAAIATLAIAGCGSSSPSSTAAQHTTTNGTSSTSTSTTAASTAPGPERVPLEAGPALAPADSTTHGTTVDGIQCAPLEQLAYHIHAHLQVYVNGQSRAIPGAIGMIHPVSQQTPVGPFYGVAQTPGSCIYWLHTHASDGILHIESPTARIYTLGDFFDEWHQALSPTTVASAEGPVTAIVNGKPWTKNPRLIPLKPHATIELAVGKPVPSFTTVSWGVTGL